MITDFPGIIESNLDRKLGKIQIDNIVEKEREKLKVREVIEFRYPYCRKVFSLMRVK